MLSPAAVNPSINDMTLINDIIQAVEADPNLSCLPDDFKKVAVETMFAEAKQRQYELENDVDVSNKRSRCDDDDVVLDVTMEGAPMED
jgi:flavoprotein